MEKLKEENKGEGEIDVLKARVRTIWCGSLLLLFFVFTCSWNVPHILLIYAGHDI